MSHTPRPPITPPPSRVVPRTVVRTYDIPKLIAWIGSQPTSEIGPER